MTNNAWNGILTEGLTIKVKPGYVTK